MMLPRIAIAATIILCAPAFAQAPVAPFEPKLVRLAEVLGSLHYLRNLCGTDGTRWRDQMDALLRSENATGERRARLVTSFNAGYQSFSTTHKRCTSSSVAAIELYLDEGETLSREIAALFGD